jgi:glycosyltransferase involved in cell wall biosynthesis
VERQLQGRSVDAVFVPSSNMVAYLQTALPMVFCADATFTQVLDSYEEYSNCSPDYLARGHEQERRALARCAAAVYPSEWAARSAVADYGADPRKVHVIPFGANVSAPPFAEIAAAVETKPAVPFRILFIGRDWKRKGGDTVLAACRIAQARGVPLQLDFVGLDEIPEALPEFAINHGLLKKSDPVKREKFESLLRAAHLVFVPSRAECYGMTFCEAAAYGVPSLTTDVGGIPTIVRRGVTGFSLPAASPASAYADAIEQCHADPAAYQALALSSRRTYDAELNWDAFGARLVEVLEQVSGQARRAA